MGCCDYRLMEAKSAEQIGGCVDCLVERVIVKSSPVRILRLSFESRSAIIAS